MKAALACLFFLVLGMRVFAELLVYIVPEGYEDEDGFHYGRPPKGWVPTHARSVQLEEELHVYGIGSGTRPELTTATTRRGDAV